MSDRPASHTRAGDHRHREGLPMKMFRSATICTLMLALTIGLVGCRKNQTQPAPQPAPVETTTNPTPAPQTKKVILYKYKFKARKILDIRHPLPPVGHC